MIRSTSTMAWKVRHVKEGKAIQELMSVETLFFPEMIKAAGVVSSFK